MNPDGEVFVADSGNGRVCQFSPTGALITTLGSRGVDLGQFVDSSGVALDTAGNIYAADCGNRRVQKLAPDGTFLLQFGSAGSGDGQFQAPRGVALDRAGNVYVADQYLHRVIKFDPSGTFVRMWGRTDGTYGTGQGEFSQPYGVVLDGAGNLYVADKNNKRVQKFGPDGEHVLSWGGIYGTGDGEFEHPIGVAVDSAGNVYVVEAAGNRVQKFTGSGAFLTKWGVAGTGYGEFASPQGIAVDAAGRVYVTQANSNRVQVFIAVPPLTASFAPDPTTGPAPLVVQFTDTSTGSPTEWTWDFGDGARDTVPNPEHTYGTPGEYTVTLTVTDARGTTATDTDVVTVRYPSPAARDDAYGMGEDGTLTVPAPGVLGNDDDLVAGVSAAALASGPAHGTLALEPDGSFVYAPGAGFAGEDSFTYTVASGPETGGPATVAIRVDARPAAAFAFSPPAPTTADTVSFTGEASVDPDGAIAAYAWDFGDGGTAAGVAASHRFATPGVYRVALAVTDDYGQTGTVSRAVTVPAYGTATFDPLPPGTTVADGQVVIDTARVASAGGTVEVSGDRVAISYGGLVTTITSGGPVVWTGESVTVGVAGVTMESQPLPAAFSSTGLIEASFATALGSFAQDAAITATLQESVAPSVESAFGLAALSEGLVVLDVAYAMVLEKTGIPGDAVTGATVRMTAGAAWVAAQGGAGNVRIVRYDDAGEVSFLETTPEDLENGLYRFTAQSSGFSVFALAGVTPAPAAVDDAYGATAGTPLVVPAPGVLGNDANAATAVPGDGPSHGTLELSADGSFAYTSAADFSGTDTFTYRASDGRTGSSPATVTIAVLPAPNRPPVVTGLQVPVEPRSVGTDVTGSATFTDVDAGDTHSATWTWGDGATSTGTVGASTVSGTHAYAAPGVYTVELALSDGEDVATMVAAQYTVVYDPDGGFVTGGGWILSPAGALAADPAVSGRATFGFVAKYRKGQIVPTGETQFQFRAAGMDFRSTAYEWLVIANAKAQYKGVGTVDGEGSYGFMLTAVDGDLKGTGSDTFRIRIWDRADDAVVYDSMVGAADQVDPSTVLGGGSVVVHQG